MMESPQIDPSKIDYDEVLKLYKGFKKAEGLVREKNRELATLRETYSQLKEENTSLLTQIQVIESLKDLTAKLQGQNALLQSDTAILLKRNQELTNLNISLEKELSTTRESNQIHSQKVVDLQSDLVNIWGRYEEAITIQQHIESQQSKDTTMIQALKEQLSSENERIESLKSDNLTYRIKLDDQQLKLQKCDEQLAIASEQLTGLSQEVASIIPTRERLLEVIAEMNTLKVDVSRLLRLLEHYPTAKGFLSSWRCGGEGGMMFLGPPTSNHRDLGLGSSRLGLEELGSGCGGLGMEEWERAGIHPEELAQMKRKSILDPFPLCSSIEDEEALWVPREALSFSSAFLRRQIPNASASLLTSFLRDLNRIWLKRERSKLKSLKLTYEAKITDLRRMADQSKSYQAVQAEKEVQRLKRQVTEGRRRSLSSGRPLSSASSSDKREKDRNSISGRKESFDTMNVDSRKTSRPSLSGSRLFGFSKDFELDDLQRSSPHLSAPNTPNRHQSSPTPRNGSPLQSTSSLAYSHQQSFDQLIRPLLMQPPLPSSSSTLFPPDTYLLGAQWSVQILFRLLLDLCQEAETHRGGLLEDAVEASRDPDIRRANHRLNLLLITGGNEALFLVRRKTDEAKKLIQAISQLKAGDAEGHNRLDNSLQSYPPTSQYPPSPSEIARPPSSMISLDSDPPFSPTSFLNKSPTSLREENQFSTNDFLNHRKPISTSQYEKGRIPENSSHSLLTLEMLRRSK